MVLPITILKETNNKKHMPIIRKENKATINFPRAIQEQRTVARHMVF